MAEDDPDMREMIASVLTGEGYAVIAARDGSELIARLHDLAKEPRGRRTLATIIADVRMPGLGGLDVLAALRCAGWQTPVILITAFGDEAIHREARDLGAVGCSTSPSRSTASWLWCVGSPRWKCHRRTDRRWFVTPGAWHRNATGGITGQRRRTIMPESVYKIIELVGTSTDSWEKAAKTAVERAAKTLRDLRVAEIAQLDMTTEDGKVVLYRAKVKVSFKYED